MHRCNGRHRSKAIMSWSWKFFQRCSCRRVPPGSQLLATTHPPTQRGATENLGKNREPYYCRDNEIVARCVKWKVHQQGPGNSLAARNSELDPRFAGLPTTMAFWYLLCYFCLPHSELSGTCPGIPMESSGNNAFPLALFPSGSTLSDTLASWCNPLVLLQFSFAPFVPHKLYNWSG